MGACLIRVRDASRFRAFVRTTRRISLGSFGPMATQAQAPLSSLLSGNVRMLQSSNVRTKIEGTALATTASKLRANIYRMLDEVLETGQPLEIQRNGKTLVIAPKEQRSIWDRLPRREGFIVGDPDELIHIDWSSEWNPDPS
jgi:hypothetical protein